MIKKTPPAACQNIHLSGQHTFYANKHPIDLEEIISNIEHSWYYQGIAEFSVVCGYNPCYIIKEPKKIEGATLWLNY